MWREKDGILNKKKDQRVRCVAESRKGRKQN
jgi:hypothetical protein